MHRGTNKKFCPETCKIPHREPRHRQEHNVKINHTEFTDFLGSQHSNTLCYKQLHRSAKIRVEAFWAVTPCYHVALSMSVALARMYWANLTSTRGSVLSSEQLGLRCAKGRLCTLESVT
jgi:hypothetical protein